MTEKRGSPIEFNRVDHISSGIGVDCGFIGVNVRYLIAEGRCEVRVQFWFKLKVGFRTITITKTLDWMGCVEGLAAAVALAEKFEIDQIELCDPEGLVPEEAIEEVRKENLL